MLNETRTIKARDIINEPDAVYALTRPYILVGDDSLTGRFDSLLEALAILKDAGWDVVEAMYPGASMLVLLENTNYKTKNR